jgi:hypothetical protein
MAFSGPGSGASTSSGQLEAARLLLEAGADPDIADSDGEAWPRACSLSLHARLH